MRITASLTPIHPKTISQLAELGEHVLFLARATLPTMIEGTEIKKATNSMIIMIAARWKASRFSIILGVTSVILFFEVRSTCVGCLLRSLVTCCAIVLCALSTNFCYNQKTNSFNRSRNIQLSK